MHRETVFITLSICITIIAASAIVARGGPLDPPGGPVSPTYKTLDDVEPRTPITSLPFDITETGSYYVTGNLSGGAGISVSAPGVTLDLMGHTLMRVGGQGPTAIEGDDVSDGLLVRNGRLVGWGTGVAVEDTGDITVENMRFESIDTNAIVIQNRARVVDCIVRDCGSTGVAVGDDSVIQGLDVSDCVGDGVVVGDGSRLTDVLAFSNGAHGIVASNACSITDCTARSNTGTGIDTNDNCVVSKCVSSGNNRGIRGNNRATINSCMVDDNAFTGIEAVNASVITECTVSNAGVAGIYVFDDCVIRQNVCTANGFGRNGIGGILTDDQNGDRNRIEDNHVTANYFGVLVGGVHNLVAGNTCQDNVVINFAVNNDNYLGTIIGDPAGAGRWDNVGSEP